MERPAVPAKLEHSVRDLADKTRLGLKTGKPGFFLHSGFWTWKHWILFLGSASVAVLLLIGLSAGNFKPARIPANARVQVQAGPPKGRALEISPYARKIPMEGRSGGFDNLEDQPETDQQSKVFSNKL